MFKAEGRARVYLWGTKEINGRRISSKHYNNLAYGTSIEGYFYFLKSLEQDLFVYFHNLSHDGEFIMWYLLENGYVYTDEEEPKEGQYNTLITDDNKYYFIKIKCNGHVIEFKCSYRMIPLSIKEMGKIVGVEKLGETYNYNEIKTYRYPNEIPETDLKYIHNDVEIMRLMILEAYQMGINKLTMAASAYSSWKGTQIQFEKHELPELDEISSKYIDMSYKGGITQVNPKYKGKILKDICSYDVNSLYPSVMLDNPMPYGEPVFVRVEDMKPKKRRYLLHIFVTEANINKGYIPFIGLRTGYGISSYEYPETLLNKELSIWYDEYNLFNTYYSGTWEIVNVLEFKQREHVFDEYFKTWKTIKETTKNPATKKIAKLMMNGLYGKFGSSKDKRSKIFDGIEGDKLHSRLIEKEVKAYYRPIASIITSYARCVLIRAIEMCHDDFIYCDTDSLYIKWRESPPHIPIDSVKLGWWDYEGKYSRFKALKAKCYIKETEKGNETRIAGLPKSAQRLVTFDNLENGLIVHKAKLARKRVKGGVILCETDFTIKL